MRVTAQRAAAAPLPYACSPLAKPANLSFTLKDLNGADVTLSAFRGKVMLVNFWATWCGPCKIEIPWFVDLQTRYGKQGLQVLGISIDDTLERLKPYAAQYGINYPVLQGLGHEDVQNLFGPLWGIPTTYIISREGKLCAKHIGATARAGFEAEVRGLLSDR
jgi:cytochrome c biogenesis protein CcmG/thiol:disulfide interchange protein DsbE